MQFLEQFKFLEFMLLNSSRELSHNAVKRGDLCAGDEELCLCKRELLLDVQWIDGIGLVSGKVGVGAAFHIFLLFCLWTDIQNRLELVNVLLK